MPYCLGDVTEASPDEAEVLLATCQEDREVTVHQPSQEHEGGIAYSRTAAEAYVSSDKVFAVVPYFSGGPGTIYIVAGADCMD